METIKLEVILSGTFTFLMGIVAYFLRQLLSDFKKVENDLTQVKNTTEIIRAEFRGMNDLLHQRIDFLERRLDRLEDYTVKE